MKTKLKNEFSKLAQVNLDEIKIEKIDQPLEKRDRLIETHQCRLITLERDKNFKLKEKVESFILEIKQL